MYQFYYADETVSLAKSNYINNVFDLFNITAIRPTMWEEHCLECSAPLCYESCVHYKKRIDGRCKRFYNSLYVYENKNGCCKKALRVKFYPWSNMLTILFPHMITYDSYNVMDQRNQKFGNHLKRILNSNISTFIKWNYIRILEYIRRIKLKHLQGVDNNPDAFIFHGYSFYEKDFQLIIEVFDNFKPINKKSLLIKPGENLIIIDKEQISSNFSNSNYIVKLYPENNLDVELEILWCDFVKGTRVCSNKSSEAKIKCVVWDLDNTLWNGTLIETENPEKLQLRNGVLECIKILDSRGILQSIASKNDYSSVVPVLKRLGVFEYFLFPQINWDAKSNSIKRIADALNIGIDTFAFIDDSVYEREQVKEQLPTVHIYTETTIERLKDFPEFQSVVTEESRKRREMYKQEEERKSLQNAEKLDITSFILKCNLKIYIFKPSLDDEIKRCYELIVRTNQLNLSGIKYNEEEFKNIILRKNYKNISFLCSDNFGSYGIVCFAQYKIENNILLFTEFAMSCRIAGKYVESAFFSFLLYYEKCESGEFTVIKTKKNQLLRNTLVDIGFKTINETSEKIKYFFDKNLKNCNLVNVEIRNKEI